jgi:hypothetical protein
MDWSNHQDDNISRNQLPVEAQVCGCSQQVPQEKTNSIRDARYPGLTIVEDFYLCDGMVHRKVSSLLFSRIPYCVNAFGTFKS